jgi:molecular chaperone DnaJ/curved DNA-binding protein
VRGEDHEYTIELSLAEAYNGTQRTFELTTTHSVQAPARQKIEVSIPAGVREGSRIRVAGKGGPGRGGGPAGDVYLNVKLRDDARFSLDGANLRAEVDVPLYTAMLGGEALVRLLSGKQIAVTVPPETQNGKTLRLKGQGWPKKPGASEHGDLIVKFKVVLPEGLSERERELFEELAAIRSGEPARARAAA